MTPRAHAHLTLPVGERDHIAGSPQAAVTLIEYGDFECPHCGRAFPMIEGLRKQLGNRMRFVYRHFPLSEMHPHAELAAEAAEAAGEQGKFWQMHHALFSHQDALEVEDIEGYATKIGLDVAAFTHALTARTYRAKVREDFMSGARSGVNGTPTFFINGARYDGMPLFDDLLTALESKASS